MVLEKTDKLMLIVFLHVFINVFKEHLNKIIINGNKVSDQNENYNRKCSGKGLVVIFHLLWKPSKCICYILLPEVSSLFPMRQIVVIHFYTLILCVLKVFRTTQKVDDVILWMTFSVNRS